MTYSMEERHKALKDRLTQIKEMLEFTSTQVSPWPLRTIYVIAQGALESNLELE